MPPILEQSSTDEQQREEKNTSTVELIWRLENLVYSSQIDSIQKLTGNLELLVAKFTHGSRFKVEKAPFQVGYNEEKICWNCTHLRKEFSSDIKQDYLFCTLEENIINYRNSGGLILHCTGCLYNSDENPNIQTLNILSQTLKGI
jgi:hypothetical protein